MDNPQFLAPLQFAATTTSIHSLFGQRIRNRWDRVIVAGWLGVHASVYR